MLLHRKSDNTWWDRVHVPMVGKENEDLWKDINAHPEKHKFMRVTQKQFDA